MVAPSSHISLRINEEDLMLLDAKIGQFGARNRSDVVRLAIHEYLRGQPRLPEMETIKIPLGRRDKFTWKCYTKWKGLVKNKPH